MNRLRALLRWFWGAEDDQISVRTLFASTPAVWILLGLVLALSVADMLAPDFAPGVERLTFYLGRSGARIAHGEWWRLVSAALTNPPDPVTHISAWNHLQGNAVGLALAGVRVEYALGTRRFVVLCILGALAGNVANFVWYPLDWGFASGTSTTVYAVYAALAVIAFVERDRSRGKHWYFVVAWILLAVNGLSAFINGAGNNTAHLGGAIAGLAVTLAWLRPRAVAGAVVAAALVGVCGTIVVTKSALARETDLRLIATIPVDTDAEFITYAFGSIWVVGRQNGTVIRVDPQTHRVLARVRVATGGSPIVAAGGRLWAGTRDVVGIDPATNRISVRVDLPGHGPWGLAASGDVLWAALADEGSIARIDMRSRAVKVAHVWRDTATVAAAGDHVWASAYDGNRTVRLDPHSLRAVASAPINAAYWMLPTSDRLWVEGGSTVYALDPESLRIRKRFDLHDWIYNIAFDPAGHLWASHRFAFGVQQIAPGTGRTLDRIDVGLGQPAGMVFVHGKIWVADPYRRSVLVIRVSGRS